MIQICSYPHLFHLIAQYFGFTTCAVYLLSHLHFYGSHLTSSKTRPALPLIGLNHLPIEKSE